MKPKAWAARRKVLSSGRGVFLTGSSLTRSGWNTPAATAIRSSDSLSGTPCSRIRRSCSSTQAVTSGRSSTNIASGILVMSSPVSEPVLGQQPVHFNLAARAEIHLAIRDCWNAKLYRVASLIAVASSLGAVPKFGAEVRRVVGVQDGWALPWRRGAVRADIQRPDDAPRRTLRRNGRDRAGVREDRARLRRWRGCEGMG